MRSSFTRNDIKKIRDDLYKLVNLSRILSEEKLEVKMLMNEMKPYISRYNVLINQMSETQRITILNDPELYNALLFTESSIKNISKLMK